MAALGVNYTDLGKEAGKIIARILKGEKPADIPVHISENLDLYISKNMRLSKVSFYHKRSLIELPKWLNKAFDNDQFGKRCQ